MDDLSVITTPIELIDEYGKWIPCSERLPEVNEAVLVTNGCAMRVCSLYDTDCAIYGAYHWEDDFQIIFDLKTWDAWMPLPKPYSEVK